MKGHRLIRSLGSHEGSDRQVRLGLETRGSGRQIGSLSVVETLFRLLELITSLIGCRMTLEVMYVRYE